MRKTDHDDEQNRTNTDSGYSSNEIILVNQSEVYIIWNELRPTVQISLMNKTYWTVKSVKGKRVF